MSMLGEQIKELRTLASELEQFIADYDGFTREEDAMLVASMDTMREAADTITSLWNSLTASEAALNKEREWMRVPVDMDGVPIRMGDTVEGELLYDNATVRGTVTTYHIHDDDEPGTVYIRVKPTEDTWTIKELQFKRCRHVKPRTLEDMLADFAYKVCDTNVDDSEIERYAEEIRAMLGEVDHGC